MGVSGSGKTTIGKMLAERLGWAFKEGDEFHPAANIKKMRAAMALNDKDRQPWLEAIRVWIDNQIDEKQPAIIACSALKRTYRDFLTKERDQVHMVFLQASQKIIAQRLAKRRGHFMPAQLLNSQFVALEMPAENEAAIIANAALEPRAIVQEIISRLIAKGLIANTHTNQNNPEKN